MTNYQKLLLRIMTMSGLLSLLGTLVLIFFIGLKTIDVIQEVSVYLIILFFPFGIFGIAGFWDAITSKRDEPQLRFTSFDWKNFSSTILIAIGVMFLCAAVFYVSSGYQITSFFQTIFLMTFFFIAWTCAYGLIFLGTVVGQYRI